MLPAALQVICSGKEHLTTAEICHSMQISGSKVTPTVYTKLEDDMDASPTERQLTGTDSLLHDGPQCPPVRLLI